MGRWSRHFVGGVLNQDTTYSSSRLVTLFIPIQSKRTRASGSALSPRGPANPHGEALHREFASRHSIRVITNHSEREQWSSSKLFICLVRFRSYRRILSVGVSLDRLLHLDNSHPLAIASFYIYESSS